MPALLSAAHPSRAPQHTLKESHSALALRRRHLSLPLEAHASLAPHVHANKQTEIRLLLCFMERLC